MKTLRISIVIISVFIMLGGVAIAQQSTPVTITFNVPVRLYDLHSSVGYATVICDVYDGSRIHVGQGLLRIEPEDGTINQNVTIVANSLTGKDITAGVQYTASFTLAVGPQQNLTPAQSASTPIEIRAKEGTAFTQTVGGNITW
jgi:hypothetical protein